MLASLAALLLAAADPSEGPVRMAPGEVPSLLSARTLPDGGSAALFTAGFPFLSASYAQGVSSGLDLGGQVELQWLTSELFAGGTLRMVTRRSGAWDVAFRARAGLGADLGTTWAVERNRSDAGLQLAPGVVASMTSAPGVLSLSADAPLTFTVKRGGGVVLAPRVGVAFETPLYGPWYAGARAGGYWHVAGGGAPLASHGRGFVDFSALLTYRLF
jgi:hypothetical protein